VVIQKSEQSGRDYKEVEKGDTLVVALRSSPHSFFLYKGQPMGYEYEMLSWMAQELGLHLKLTVPHSWSEIFSLVGHDKIDVIAAPLAMTVNSLHATVYTEHLYTTRPMLVQRKPKNWRKMSLHAVEKQVVRRPLDLLNKKVVVAEGSVYAKRLDHLGQELGGTILTGYVSAEVPIESLIVRVARGEMEYTVADEHILQGWQAMYPDLDIHTPLGFEQRIAWAVPQHKKKLLEKINAWIVSKRGRSDSRYNEIFARYFQSQGTFLRRMSSPYHSLGGGQLSPFDSLFKKYAALINWDWRLLAAMAFEESGWNPQAQSPMGAVGLMQMLPQTALEYGVNEPLNPSANLEAAVRYLASLEVFWKSLAPPERQSFVMASFNAGPGHILDAVALAKHYGQSGNEWKGAVSEWLLKKNQEKVYNHSVVKYGYCRGKQTVEYVRRIKERYIQFKLHSMELKKVSVDVYYPEWRNKHNPVNLILAQAPVLPNTTLVLRQE